MADKPGRKSTFDILIIVIAATIWLAAMAIMALIGMFAPASAWAHLTPLEQALTTAANQALGALFGGLAVAGRKRG